MCIRDRNSPQGVEAATIGAEAGTSWLVKCLEYYNEKTFVDSSGKEQTAVLPSILQDCISRNFDICYIDSPLEFNVKKNTVCVLPMDYFLALIHIFILKDWKYCKK